MPSGIRKRWSSGEPVTISVERPAIEWFRCLQMTKVRLIFPKPNVSWEYMTNRTRPPVVGAVAYYGAADQSIKSFAFKAIATSYKRRKSKRLIVTRTDADPRFTEPRIENVYPALGRFCNYTAVINVVNIKRSSKPNSPPDSRRSASEVNLKTNGLLLID